MFTNFKKFEVLYTLNEAISDNVDDIKALNKMRRCFTQIITNFGFFAELLFNLNIAEAKKGSGINTMATDGKSIIYDPSFVNELTEEEIVFVIIHEIMHNANLHFARMSGRNHNLWNQAADYAINYQIDQMREDLKSNILKAPKDILLDSQYANMSAEEIYDILEKKMPPPQPGSNGQGQPGQGQPGQGQPGQGQPGQGQPGQGQPGQGQPGQGQPSPGQAGGTPEGDIRAPGSLDGKGNIIYEGSSDVNDAKTTAELEKTWGEIKNNVAAKTQGTGSASFDRWIRKQNKPKINWRAELKKFVAQVYDQLDYAFFNKRYLSQDMYLPGPKEADKSTYENVVVAIDTSGSINDDTLGKFAAELMKLFKTYSIRTLYVIWCDSRICDVQTIDVADGSFDLNKLKPCGGGGTSFKPPFEWVQKNVLKKGKIPAFMIYFTDAYGDAPAPAEYNIKSYGNRVLWVITDNDSAPHLKFGKKLYIDKMPG